VSPALLNLLVQICCYLFSSPLQESVATSPADM